MAIITKARMQQLRGKYNQLNKEALLPGEFAICDDHNPIVRTSAGYKELLTEDNAEYFENKVVEIDNAISSTNKAIADMEQATSDNTQRVDNAIQQIQTKIGIDDTQSSILTTYSSNKIDDFISDINDSLGDKIDATGDVSEAVVSTLGEIPDTRLLPSVGDKIKVMFAKTIRYFQDLKTIAFTGDYEDLLNKPSIPTVTNNLLATESGTALDAVQGKVINDKIGSTDISAIGDGTVTGAVSTLNSNLSNPVIVKSQVVTTSYGDITYKKFSNGFKSISFSFRNINTSTNDKIDIFNAIPDEFKPLINTTIVCQTYNNYSRFITLNLSDRRILLYKTVGVSTDDDGAYVNSFYA